MLPLWVNPVIIPENVVDKTTAECAAECGLGIKEKFSEEFFEASFNHKPGELIADRASISNETDFSGIYNITFITEDMYIKLGGEPQGLKENEVAVCPYNANAQFGEKEFTLLGKKYSVKNTVDQFPIDTHMISVKSAPGNGSEFKLDLSGKIK